MIFSAKSIQPALKSGYSLGPAGTSFPYESSVILIQRPREYEKALGVRVERIPDISGGKYVRPALKRILNFRAGRHLPTKLQDSHACSASMMCIVAFLEVVQSLAAQSA